jgi:hypothetical protein
MKPAFALDFRNSSVGLLHRAAGGWQVVGSVALDTPDLPEALNYLRSTALGLSPKGITTKLIIPDDQILYTAVTAPGPTAAERLAQVTAALEGRTPYDVADLAFDILGDGPEVTVAVIAKETLAEAEAFAVEHRFNPVSFVAVPERADITGEPWFGMTTSAASIIGADKTVSRDTEAVVISQRARTPEAEETAAEAEPAAPAEPAAEIEAAAPPAEIAEPTAEIAAISEPALEPEATEAPQDPALLAGEPDLPAQALAATLPLDPARPAPPSTDAASDRELIARLGDALATPIAQPPRETAPAAAPADDEEAPMALDVAPEDGPDEEPQGAAIISAALSGKSARVTETSIEDPQPTQPLGEAIAGFSSRRMNSAAPAGKAPSLGAAPGGRAAAGPKPAAPSKAAAAAKRGVGALVSAATAPKRQKVELTKASANAAATLTATSGRKATAKPGNGFAPRQPIRGKPRYLGLLMTVVLLFLLAMVAAWSSYSLGVWNSEPSEPAQPVLAQTDAGPLDPSLADEAVPDVADEMAADLQDPEASADGQDSPAAELTAQGPANAPMLTQDMPKAAPLDGSQDEIYLASIDAPPAAPDPLSLPLPDARGDPLPLAQAAPPPFGTVYQFAADGTIRPTPEGIITPEGVLLRAGRPPRVPAERPASLVPTQALPEAPIGADAAQAAFADPALIGKQPKPRPANLVPAAPADQGSLAPLAGSRVASLRPQPRPAQIQAAGESARLASAAGSLSTAPASLGSQAIAISRKPVARPKDMSRAVEDAIAVALQQPAPALTSSTAAIAIDPQASEADGEPDVVASTQKTPLRTTVAKQATYKNAINLSQMNLIGVYGTQSNRYALVRQFNGRYKKVKVGDTIDGGRVAAITASEVRYQKGSRLIALALPKD